MTDYIARLEMLYDIQRRLGVCITDKTPRTNDHRVREADVILQTFHALTGVDPDPEADGAETALGDMLAHLMHYCTAYAVDFDEALERARGHFEAELEEDCPGYGHFRVTARINLDVMVRAASEKDAQAVAQSVSESMALSPDFVDGFNSTSDHPIVGHKSVASAAKVFPATRADLCLLHGYSDLDADNAGNPCVWRNFYRKGTDTWAAEWSCQCDDDGVEPYKSVWIGPGDGPTDIWLALPEAT